MILPRMEERALIRAARITLRRVILANFPPGAEREQLPRMACGLM
jgi:hypothetical protein